MTPTERPAWKKLTALATQLRDKPLVELIEEPQRATRYTLSVAGCLFDFGKQWVDQPVMSELLNLAQQCQVLDRAQAMFAGDAINASEHRPVLHSHPCRRDEAP